MAAPVATATPVTQPTPDLPGIQARAAYDLRGLRAWRSFLGVVREELARETDISHTTLYQVEAGRTRMRGRLVAQIADALGIPAPILVAYAPTDQEARAYALLALVARAEKRIQRLESLESMAS